MDAAGDAPEGSAAYLVLRASEPWRPQTHEYFPEAARARAVELMVIGHRLEREDRFAGAAAVALWDAWMGHVVPQAVVRGLVAE